VDRNCKTLLHRDDPAFAVCEAIVGEKASKQGCRNRKSNELAIRLVATGKPAPCRILGKDEINQFLATTEEFVAFEFADNLTPLFGNRAVCKASICQADVYILAQAGLPLLTDDEISMCIGQRPSTPDFSESAV